MESEKVIIVDFREFGLNNPTVIQFCPSKNEFVRYEIKGASVEQICIKIKNLEKLFNCKKVKYITSACNLKKIKECSLANVIKSVWELFNENGIWQPNKQGLGMGHVFDELNKIYGEDFIKYK